MLGLQDTKTSWKIAELKDGQFVEEREIFALRFDHIKCCLYDLIKGKKVLEEEITLKIMSKVMEMVKNCHLLGHAILNIRL